MRRKYSIALFLMAWLFSLTACTKKVLPETRLEIEDFRNEWLVVNYWASWCKPCIKEIPELNKLHQSRKDITVIGVNYDGMSGEELAIASSKLGINFPNLSSDPSSELETSRPIVLPTTMIVDKKLKLRDKLIGPQTLESISFSIMEASKDLIQEKTNTVISP
ncbi:MAG: TlpA disulfide reductase family protein [Halieaceae bacterium]|nr:TlpA disulfide reductase family protein [Halieaceae bacterium]